MSTGTIPSPFGLSWNAEDVFAAFNSFFSGIGEFASNLFGGNPQNLMLDDEHRDEWYLDDYERNRAKNERQWRDNYLATHGHYPEEGVRNPWALGDPDDPIPDPDPDPDPEESNMMQMIMMMMLMGGGGFAAGGAEGGILGALLPLLLMSGGGLSGLF
jgi:hypothetical protein